jgi:hypothetical protein
MKNTRWAFFLVLFFALQVGQLFSRDISGEEIPSFYQDTWQPDFVKNRVIPVFMVIVSIGMAAIWTADIASGKFSGKGNFLRWREGENLMWPHIFAEYLIAAGMITGGLGLYFCKSWAFGISLLSLGALIYSAINSSGWVLAEKNRLAYGIPMWISLAGSAVAAVILLS